MKISFQGAANTVTGSFFVIETQNACFAIDCGLFQGSKSLQERNYQDFKISPANIDFVLLTHAHIDHSGLLPKLCKKGFRGPIYCSEVTEDLCRVMLPDSGHIQESEVERKNRKLSRQGKELLEPIYTTEDAQNCLSQFRTLNTDEVINLGPGIEVRLRNAGHILGACIIELWVDEDGKKTKLVFSGDLGNFRQPIVKDPTVIESADYIIIESTYGSRLHDDPPSRADELLQVINDTMKKGGNLIIPAFAVERTQDLLHDLIVLGYQGKLDPDIKIYIDSPLAIAATDIFLKNTDWYEDSTREFVENNDPLSLISLNYSLTTEESMELNQVRNKTIIISASGMCEAGRIKHHLKHNLWRPESTILIVGYQAAGSLGRKLVDGEEVVTIHGEKVAVKADIKRIEAYSAHADQEGLMKWLRGFVNKPHGVFIVHGEEESQNTLAEIIKKELDLPVYIPEWQQEYNLIAPEESHSTLTRNSYNVLAAMQAEQMYLHMCLKLNEMFQQNIRDGNYEKINETVRRITAVV